MNNEMVLKVPAAKQHLVILGNVILNDFGVYKQ